MIPLGNKIFMVFEIRLLNDKCLLKFQPIYSLKLCCVVFPVKVHACSSNGREIDG